MKDLLEFGLQVAGWSQLLLVLGSLGVPAALNCKEGLKVLAPLLRQMWWTYAGYICFTHLFFAILSLTHGAWLIDGGGPAALLLGFIILWWLVRLVVHFNYFDRTGIPHNRFNVVAEMILVTLFCALILVYGTTLYLNLGGKELW